MKCKWNEEILSQCGSEKENEKRSQGLNSFQDHNRHVECRDVGMNIKKNFT